jgi:cell division septal protein FtsQ
VLFGGCKIAELNRNRGRKQWRVARGLFRLWLVLSVLWIGGVGVVAWQSFPTAPGIKHLALKTENPRSPP